MWTSEGWPRFLPLRRHGALAQLAIALACILGAWIARLPFSGLLGASMPFATMFPALMLATVLGGPVAGVATLLAGGVAALRFSGGDPWWSAVAYGTWLVMGGSLCLVAVMLRSLAWRAREQRDALNEREERLRTVVREMGHRAKNGLTVIIAIVQQTARTATSAADLETKLVNRLGALGSAQDLVTEAGGSATAVSEVIARVLAPFGPERFDLAPPPQDDARLAADPTSTIALLLHELATNAVKHGALSAPQGRVRVAWRHEAATIVLDWTETGGPPVGEAASTGFGLRLLRSALQSYGGASEITFAPEGLRCRLRAPSADAPPV